MATKNLPVILGPDGHPVRSRAVRSAGYGNGFYGGYGGRGGLRNPTSGLGGMADKGSSSFYTPMRFHWRNPLEVLYYQSWACAKLVDIPANDTFLAWREWSDGEVEGAGERMAEAERRHRVKAQLNKALKAARAYGSGLAILVTREAPLTEPLMPERVRPNDLVAIRVFDRFDASIHSRVGDIMDPNYGQPEMYHMHPSGASARPFMVHASRVLRFDGIAALSDSGSYIYGTQDWGESLLLRTILPIIQDQGLVSAIAQMGQEASIPVLRVDGLREVISGTPDPDEPSADEIGERFNEVKSVWNVAMLDKEAEEFDRVAIAFTGLADLMNRFEERIAAAADIPMTRFMGQSPGGLNSTGASDQRNYIMKVEGDREMHMAGQLPVLDEVLARDAGLGEAPPFTWSSLLEMSEKEKAEAAKTMAEALDIAARNNAIGEDEFRRAIDGNPIFGDLPGDPPFDPTPDPEFEPPAPPGAE